MDDVWAMPIVTRIEKSTPPSRRDMLEASARAVMMISDDPRARSEWEHSFATWLAGPFRKVTRRARGARWSEAEAVPGVSVTVGSATVRAYPPTPVSATPEPIRRLQVAGTDLEPLENPDPLRPVPTLWVNPHLEMTAGKTAAQVGHAAMMLGASMDPSALERWRSSSFDLQVALASPAQWEDLLTRGVLVRDAGFTEITPGSITVIATP